MKRNMENLADALRDLSWAEMVKVSDYIASSVIHHWKNNEPVDRDSVAEILNQVSDDIIRSAELEEASQPKPST